MSDEDKSIKQRLKEEAVPSLASGVIGAVASNMIMGVDYTQQLPFMGMNVPAYLVIGGTVAGSVMASELLHDYVLENIPMINAYADAESRILAPVMAGGFTYLLFRTQVSAETSLMNSALLGAGSAVAGKYVGNTLLNRM